MALRIAFSKLTKEWKISKAVSGTSVEQKWRNKNREYIISATLEEIFRKDETIKAYHAFKEYVEWRRNNGDVSQYSKSNKECFTKKEKRYSLKLVSAIFWQFSSHDNLLKTMKNVFHFI